jgi:hypothetical protein
MFDFGDLSFGDYSFDVGSFDDLAFEFPEMPIDDYSIGAVDYFDAGSFDPYAYEFPADVALDADYGMTDWGGYDDLGFDLTEFDVMPDVESTFYDFESYGGVTYEPDISASDLSAATGVPLDQVSSWSFDFPDVSMNDVLNYAKQGVSLYQAFQQAQTSPTRQTTTTASGQQTTMVRDPRTGQMVQTVRDPRTGQLVPAMIDPRTGQLVPKTSAGLIPGVSNQTLLIGAAVAAGALILLTPQRKGRR